MTSLLSSITSGDFTDGVRMVVSGVEKVGKTTFVSQIPNSLFIPCEAGYATIKTPKTERLYNFSQVMSLLDEIIAARKANQFPFKTIIFDSASATEEFIHDQVLASDPSWVTGKPKPVSLIIDTALGGYGKGHSKANLLFQEFLAKCDLLASFGKINIVMTCHVFASAVKDPIHGDYTTFELQLHSPKNERTYGKREMITRWADIIGFMYQPITVISSETGNTMAKSLTGARVLGVSRRPEYVAGSRWPIGNEIPLPIDDGWNHFAKALHNGSGIDWFNRSLVAKKK